jgi:rod shape-determining protein MreC
VIVDKGNKDGVYIGQPVLDAYGVLGQVIRVGQMTSTILLITDSSHALPLQSNRSGSRAIGVGTHAFNQLELANVTNNADIKTGDLMITSGLGGRFPAGYPVGVVSHVQRDRSQPFAHVILLPSAHIDSAREVLLVWPGKAALGLPATAQTLPPPVTPAPAIAQTAAKPAAPTPTAVSAKETKPDATS